MRHVLCVSFTVLLAACANEVMTTRPPDPASAGSAGANSSATAGMAGSIVAGNTGGPAASAGTSGGLPDEGSGGEPSAGSAGSGGTLEGGTGGSGGAAGSSTAGSGGSGGGSPVAEQLSQGKASTSDSEEAGKGNTADMGNDGQEGTRWCANDSALDHWWAVDLGQSHTLTHVQVLWEQAVAYQYLIEGSGDGTNWSPLLDRTDSTSTSQLQAMDIDGEARHVRITVTGLPEGSWASFFEFRVYGY